jgi:Zn-dependent protease with chaperone function
MLILNIVASDNAIGPFFFKEPLLAICLAMLLYIFVITLIYLQNILLKSAARQNKNKMLILANSELAIFFMGYYFIFGIHRLFSINQFFLANSFSIIFAIILYLGGVATFNYAQNRLIYGKRQAFLKTKLELWFLIPFLLPFFLYLILNDFATFIPWKHIKQYMGIEENSIEEMLGFSLFGLIFIFVMTVVIPKTVVLCWKCKDLDDSPLKERLIALCQRAKFKYNGLKTWEIMQDSMTAAIIGIWERFRYVMFTPSLLRHLSSNAITAVLAHEIGHSKYKHLLIYPFIIFGILLLSSFLVFISYSQVIYFLDKDVFFSLPVGNILNFLLFFIMFALILALLFRLIFGYFSRLFERQADLYIFELGLPAAYLIEAFDEIAIASGRIHNIPNWHHYSMQQRIDFLKEAEKNTSLIYIHRRKVVLSLSAYFFCLGSFLYFIFFIY